MNQNFYNINLLLLRHAQSEGNIDHTVYKTKNPFDIDLTPAGEEQLQQLHNLPLFSNGNEYNRKLIVISSPMLRAKKTALGLISSCINNHKILEHNTVLQYDLSLSERFIGKANGSKSIDAYLQTLPNKERDDERFNRKTLGILYQPPGGESFYQLYLRLNNFHNNLIYNVLPNIIDSHKENTLVIVSHAVTMTVYKRMLSGYFLENLNDTSTEFHENCSYFKIRL